MKLLNAGLVDTIDSFLHAGYMSAYPRPLESMAYPPGSGEAPAAPSFQIDLSDALRLKQAGGDGGDPVDASAALISSNGNHELLIGALTLAGFLVLVYLLRRTILKSRPLRAFSIAAASMCMAMMMFVTYCKEENVLPTDKPWEGISLRSYENPEQATLAILWGIIVPATAGIGQQVSISANIQNEAALPVKDLDEGMQYALSTYGLDGWGNEFQLEVTTKKNEDGKAYGSYTVTSGGADKTFGTDDDMKASFDQTINDGWGWTVQKAFFLVEKDGQAQVLFHRWNNKMFEYNDKAAAEEITDSELFDILPRDRLSADQIAAVDEAFSAATAAASPSSSPVLLQVFDI